MKDAIMKECKGCGELFVNGYSPGLGLTIKTGSGVLGGALYCCKKCYEKNASQGEKIWDLLCSPPALLWTIMRFSLRMFFRLVRLIFSRIVFTKFFWKYVAPVIAALIGIGMFLAHLEFVKKCEAEMIQFSENVDKEAIEVVGKLKQERKAVLAAKEKKRAEEAQRQKEKEEQQRAELAAALSAAKEEALRQKIAQDMSAFAEEHLPEKWSRLLQTRKDIVDTEQKIAAMQSDTTQTDFEENETGASLLKNRNRLIREKRHLELEIEDAFTHRK